MGELTRFIHKLFLSVNNVFRHYNTLLERRDFVAGEEYPDVTREGGRGQPRCVFYYF
jgi:hypothetical protein